MSFQAIATAAGSLATGVFIASTIPMLVKAVRTRDLASYSGAHLVGANIGNAATRFSRWDDALVALVELAERPRPLPAIG